MRGGSFSVPDPFGDADTPDFTVSGWMRQLPENIGFMIGKQYQSTESEDPTACWSFRSHSITDDLRVEGTTDSGTCPEDTCARCYQTTGVVVDNEVWSTRRNVSSPCGETAQEAHQQAAATMPVLEVMMADNWWESSPKGHPLPVIPGAGCHVILDHPGPGSVSNPHNGASSFFVGLMSVVVDSRLLSLWLQVVVQSFL